VSGEAVLRGDGLSKTYGKRRVLHNVSVEVKSGEIVGLLGPNGAGKTTPYSIIVGLIRPDKGTVICKGEEITRLPMYQRARKGVTYLPQEASVFRKLTVEENLLAILQTLPLSSTEQRERLAQLLGDLRIDHLAKNRADSLSGGDRRRTACGDRARRSTDRRVHRRRDRSDTLRRDRGRIVPRDGVDALGSTRIRGDPPRAARARRDRPRPTPGGRVSEGVGIRELCLPMLIER